MLGNRFSIPLLHKITCWILGQMRAGKVNFSFSEISTYEYILLLNLRVDFIIDWLIAKIISCQELNIKSLRSSGNVESRVSYLTGLTNAVEDLLIKWLAPSMLLYSIRERVSECLSECLSSNAS